MATMEGKFIDGCAASGTAPAVAKDLWSLMTAAADYSFNKSHAACYALISYRTAYLKANYPAEYMAAVISSVMSTKDKVPFFVNRCDEMGIEVLPPDVNSSDHGFVVSGNSIRFGLDAVKNVGHAAVEAIIAAREGGGPFESIWDFCERVDSRAVNKRAIECLVKCGALDSTGATRAGDAGGAAAAQAAGQKAQEDARRGQGSIFDLGGGATAAGRPRRRLGGTAAPAGARARSSTSASCCGSRRRRSGTFLSSHPLAEVREALRAPVDCPLADVSRASRRRLGHGRRDRRRGEEGAHAARRLRRCSRSSTTSRGRWSCSSATPPSEAAEAIEVDRVVVIRGRVDQRGGGQAEPGRPGGRARSSPAPTSIAAARAKRRAARPAR